jgi:hypothetical protein
MRILPGSDVRRKNPYPDPLVRAQFPREVGGANSWTAVVLRLFVGRGSLPGWRGYHTAMSVRSQEGYPDLTLVHAATRTLVFAELKTETGVVTDMQAAWLLDLAQTDALVYLWRPSDRDEIDGLLQEIHEQWTRTR